MIPTSFYNPPITFSEQFEIPAPVQKKNAGFDQRQTCPQSSKLQQLADIGAILISITALFTLFSRIIPRILTKRLSGNALKAFQQNFWLKRLLTKEDALKLGLQMGSLTGLLVQLYDLETAINTQQPSKLVAKLSNMLLAGITFFFPGNLLLRGGAFICASLWTAGERNDIQNSLNLNSRREFDCQKLATIFSIPSLKTFIANTSKNKHQRLEELQQELLALSKYVSKDIHDAFSFKPWHDLFAKNSRQWFSQIPQPHQTALSSQFNLLAALGAISVFWTARSTSSKMLKVLPKLQTGAQCAAFLALFLQNVPLWMRAWQTRDQNDSRLMLFGIPAMIIGRTLFLSKNFLFLSGLNGIGGVIQSKGLESNSQKYRGSIDYLKNVYTQAVSNPQLSAQDVLAFLYQGNRLKELQHRFGKTRVDFLSQTLTQAKQKQQTEAMPLATYLAPIVFSNRV